MVTQNMLMRIEYIVSTACFQGTQKNTLGTVPQNQTLGAHIWSGLRGEKLNLSKNQREKLINVGKTDTKLDNR